MKILISLFVLSFIICIHELGHFWAARFFNIPVDEFSIGMGAEVYTYDGQKTKYSFKAIPIGGYVNIKGIELGDKTPNGFNTKPAFSRFIILFAGVFMNFILGYLIMFILAFSIGSSKPSKEPIIGSVVNTQKNISKFKAGDKIIKISDKEVFVWEDIRNIIDSSQDKTNPLKILVERNGENLLLDINLYKNQENNKYYFGIIPEMITIKYSFIKSSKMAWSEFTNIFKEIFSSFKLIITGKVNREEVSGPIGIINIVGETSRLGVSSLFWLVAILSINIGVLNLLPFPALDGGRIIFILFELFGIKINKNIEEKIHYFGMIILFGAIIFVTTNDLINLGK